MCCIHKYVQADFLLTYDSKIITEAACRCIPEVDSAAVNTLVVQPDVLHHELRRLGYCAEVRPGSKHFRCWPMPCLAQRFASDVETADKPHESFKKYAYWNLSARETRIAKDPLFAVP